MSSPASTFVLPKPKKKFSSDVYPVPTITVSTTEFTVDYDNLDANGNPTVIPRESMKRVKIRGFDPDKDTTRFAHLLVHKSPDIFPPSAELHLVKMLDRLKVKIIEANTQKESDKSDKTHRPVDPLVSQLSTLSPLISSVSSENVVKSGHATTSSAADPLSGPSSFTHSFSPPPVTELLSPDISFSFSPTKASQSKVPITSRQSDAEYLESQKDRGNGESQMNTHRTPFSLNSSQVKETVPIVLPQSQTSSQQSYPAEENTPTPSNIVTTSQFSSPTKNSSSQRPSSSTSPRDDGSYPPRYTLSLGIHQGSSGVDTPMGNLSRGRNTGPFATELSEGTTMSLLSRLNLPDVSVQYLDSYLEALYSDGEDETTLSECVRGAACILRLLQEGDVETLLQISEVTANALSRALSSPAVRERQPVLCGIVLEIFYSFSMISELQRVVVEKKVGASALAVISSELHRVEIQCARMATRQRQSGSVSLNSRQSSSLSTILQNTDKLLFIAIYLLFNLCHNRNIEAALAPRLTPLLLHVLLKDSRMHIAITAPETYTLATQSSRSVTQSQTSLQPSQSSSADLSVSSSSTSSSSFSSTLVRLERVGEWSWQSACAPQLSILCMVFLRRLASLPTLSLNLPAPTSPSFQPLGASLNRSTMYSATVSNRFANRVLIDNTLLRYCAAQLKSPSISTVAATLRLLYNVIFSIPLLQQQVYSGSGFGMSNSPSSVSSTISSTSAIQASTGSSSSSLLLSSPPMTHVSANSITTILDFFTATILPILVDLLSVPSVMGLASRILYALSTSPQHGTSVCKIISPHVLWLARTALDSPQSSHAPRADTEVCALLINLVAVDAQIASKLLVPSFIHLLLNKVCTSQSIMRAKLLRALSEYTSSAKLLSPYAFDIALIATRVLESPTQGRSEFEKPAVKIDLYSLELLGVLGNIDDITVDWHKLCTEYDLHTTVLRCISLLYVQQQQQQQHGKQKHDASFNLEAQLSRYDDVILLAVIVAGVIFRNAEATSLLCQSSDFLDTLADVANYAYSISDFEIVQQTLFAIARVMLHPQIRVSLSYSPKFVNMLLRSVSNQYVSIRILSNTCIDTIIEIDPTNSSALALLARRFGEYNAHYLHTTYPELDFSHQSSSMLENEDNFSMQMNTGPGERTLGL